MRWWALAGAAGLLPCAGVACGLDLAGLGEAADGGLETASPESGSSADGSVNAGETGPGPEAAAPEGGTDSTVDSPGEDALQETATGDGPAPPPEAGCTGVLCNGACLSASDCQTCSGALLFCAGSKTCGADCTACTGAPIQCFACDTNRQNPIGTCQPDDPNAYCLDTNYSGTHAGADGEHCGCTFATDCPGQDQVCISVGGGTVFGCFSCGEAFTQQSTCKNGGKCNEPQANCH